MKRILLASVAMAAALFATAATAAPVVYDFTGPNANTNTDLGQTEVYSATGGPNLTAVAGYATGAAPPSNGDTFAISNGNTYYHVVGNNRGADEQGLGVCISSFNLSCSLSSTLQGEQGEIDRAANEVIQLDLSALYALYTNFTINADSVTNTEVMGVFQSASATSIGTLLTQTDTGGSFGITPTQRYLYFASIGPAAGGSNGGNVLLHSLTVIPDVDINPTGTDVPEPGSLLVFGSALIGMAGIVGVKRRRRNDGTDVSAA